MNHMTNEQRAKLEAFKAAVLKDVPEFLGSVELYNPQTGCYCIAGLALKNEGYDVATLVNQYYNDMPAIKGESPYTIFNKHFGLNSGTIGCTNDSIVRASEHVVAEINPKEPKGFDFKKAPAREVIAKVFEAMEHDGYAPETWLNDIIDG